MTTLVVEPLLDVSPEAAVPGRRGAGPGGGLTLEGLLSGAWEGLAARASVACPVCTGDMRPRGADAAGRPVGGGCRDCGTELR
jgi:hypothetical protein